MAGARIMFGLADSKVMAPPAPDPRYGGRSVPAVRLLMGYDAASDSETWRLDIMAVHPDGQILQHTYTPPVGMGRNELTAANIGEGLCWLGERLKERR